MKHLGDIKNINGATIEPVDVITFGSPCQNLSITGNRTGILHAELGNNDTNQSGLFIEAIRIIKEMRDATNGEYPKFAVWENVPGAYISRKGNDFHRVLTEFVKLSSEASDVPKPKTGGWRNAGEIMGHQFSIAWRTFNAEYWGVAQRRRRIYLVADFRGERAGKVLFERGGLRRDPAQSRFPWEEIASNNKDGVRTTNTKSENTYIINNTLAVENHPQDSRVTIIPDCKCQTLTHKMGTGGGNVPLVLETESIIYSLYPQRKAECISLLENISNTLVNGSSPGFHNCILDVHGKIRRLTPLECGRLQGFPDYWCTGLENPNPTEEEIDFWKEVFERYRLITAPNSRRKTINEIKKWLASSPTDTPIYKMWGNGIALPNAVFVLQGIADELRKENEDG